MHRPLLITLALTLLITFNAFAWPIPDTGQTKCYDTDGNEIPCAGTGQDGEYSINPMSYTKLSGQMKMGR